MLLLARAALQHGKRFALLMVAFIFMLLATTSSQMEAVAIGSVTRSGPEFFQLFEGKNDGQELSLSEVQEQWHQIPRDGGDVITRGDAIKYVGKKKRGSLIDRAMNKIVGHADFSKNLKVLAIVLILVAVIKAISLFGSQFTKQLVTIRVSRDLRQRYFEHIQTLSLDFYSKYNVGSLSARVSGDAQTIAASVYSAIVAYVQTPIAVVTSITLCFMVSVQLSLIVFICFPVLVFPILYFARRIKRVARRMLANSETYSAALLDSLSGIQTVKLFAMEKFSIRKFREQNDEMARLAEKGAKYGYMSRPILHMVSTLILCGIFVYGLYFAHLTISEILVFCLLVYVMYDPIKRWSDENMAIQQGVAAAERLYQVLDLEPTIADAADAQELQGFKDRIEFDDVWFRYGEEWVLRGLSFEVKRGEVVALVGSTGAGKSTIANLLPRLYEAEKGEIRIDGHAVAAYTQGSLREQMAFVPQRPFLFLDSVAENISFGRDFSREEIIDAARRAHADEFIRELEFGYDTPLKEGGKNLSGGQQQRLAIARALVRRSPILVLDEATSSLDAVSENLIKEAINELRGEVTQVLIAHRLSTIEHADKIIFLDQGRMIASGTKKQLLESCPPFKAMWDLMHAGT